MEATAKIKAIFDDGGSWEEEIPVQYPNAGDEKQAQVQVLAMIRQVGIIQTLTEDTLKWIPMSRVREIEIKLNKVVLAGAGEDAASRTKANQLSNAARLCKG